MSETEDLFRWLNKFLNESITVDEVPKNIFDISGYPHYENVISNIYAFFLREEEEHNFGRLFIDSLLELIPENYFENKEYSSSDFIGEYQVAREFYSNESGRIDLVISSKPVDDFGDEEKDTITENVNKDWVLIIENKINHSLGNNLDDYWNTFDNKMMKIGVVLSLDEVEIDNTNFVRILHKDLLENVISNLRNSFLNSSDKYLIYLKDFIQNILNQRNKPILEDMEKNFNLYKKSYNEIKELKKLETQVYKYLNDSFISFFDKTKFTHSTQKITAATGRHFAGDEGTIYEPFRFWINYESVFDKSKVYVIFEIHNKKNTKVNFNFDSCYNKDKFNISTGGGIGKDYRHIYRKDILFESSNVFSEEIAYKLKSEFFKDEIDKDSKYKLCDELQCVVDSFAEAIESERIKKLM